MMKEFDLEDYDLKFLYQEYLNTPNPHLEIIAVMQYDTLSDSFLIYRLCLRMSSTKINTSPNDIITEMFPDGEYRSERCYICRYSSDDLSIDEFKALLEVFLVGYGVENRHTAGITDYKQVYDYFENYKKSNPNKTLLECTVSVYGYDLDNNPTEQCYIVRGNNDENLPEEYLRELNRYPRCKLFGFVDEVGLIHCNHIRFDECLRRTSSDYLSSFQPRPLPRLNSVFGGQKLPDEF